MLKKFDVKTIGKNYTILFLLAFWVTFCFKNAFTNGMDVRVLPYTLDLSQFSSVVYTSSFVWAYYVLQGLLAAVACYILLRILYSVIARALPACDFSPETFIAIFGAAVCLNNILVGIVMWCCFANALLYPIATVLGNIVIGTPLYFCAFFYFKKQCLNPVQAVRAFNFLAGGYVLYWAGSILLTVL